ncbi:MAG: LptF/LptG family permease, partial [Smithellaceae bacterium]
MVIMIFIGMSFSFRSERGGGIMQSLAVGIVIGFSYWIVHAVFMASGQSGTIPPVIAAWSANVIFSAAAAFLFYKVRT